jgi:DDE superfamily endonuclease.
LHITTHLEADNLTGSKGWTDRFKGRNNLIVTLWTVKEEILIKKHKMTGKMTTVTYIMFIRQFNFSIDNVVKSYLLSKTLPRGYIIKQSVPVLLSCNADGSNKLPPHATGRYESPHCFK